MATTSSPLPIGSQAPAFSLPDVCEQGALWTLGANKAAPATVVIFMCNHCPYVVHIIEHLGATVKQLLNRGVEVVAICSNDSVAYPDDAPVAMAGFAAKHAWTAPYLSDETQDVARRYMAACTPEFYILDANLCIAYHGRYDSSRPGSGIPVTGKDLLNAVEQVLIGEVPAEQLPSIGCSIKWKTAG